MSAPAAPEASSQSPQGLRFGSIRQDVGAREAESGVWVVEWVLKRNCSISPRQLMAFYASLCVVSLGIASFFWANGATLVMPFTWAELVAVGVALVAYGRHAADRECIALQQGRLTVENRFGGHVEHAEFLSDRVRVEPQHDDLSLIELSGQGRSVCVGRYVRPELRRQLAEEFRAVLRGRSVALVGRTG